MYHEETDSNELINFLQENGVIKFFISELTLLEFDSIVWKNLEHESLVKLKHWNLLNCLRKMLITNCDDNKFGLVKLNMDLINLANKLLAKYGELGLITLDAIQFVSAQYVKDEVSKTIASDKLLQTFFKAELQ